MITISGLNSRQKTLCEIMWSLEEFNAVEAFIATLPRADRLECRTLIQLMIMAFADEVTDLELAQDALAQFKL